MDITGRITGALLGLACGDALGAPAEFISRSQLETHWGELTEMVGDGPWEPGEWAGGTGMGLWEAAQSAADLGSLSPDTPGPAPLPPGFWERLAAVETKSYDQLQPSGYAGYIVDCLEAAAWCCLSADSLEETLILAVNLAGEAD